MFKSHLGYNIRSKSSLNVDQDTEIHNIVNPIILLILNLESNDIY